ncbi:MAG: hypothetical protein ACX930_10685 [Erythrobacter sp.]
MREEVDNWKPLARGEVLWLHFRRHAVEVQPWFEADLGIPEPTSELLVSDSTRPRALREGDALIATVRGIDFSPSSSGFQTAWTANHQRISGGTTSLPRTALIATGATCTIPTWTIVSSGQVMP